MYKVMLLIKGNEQLIYMREEDNSKGRNHTKLT